MRECPKCKNPFLCWDDLAKAWLCLGRTCDYATREDPSRGDGEQRVSDIGTYVWSQGMESFHYDRESGHWIGPDGRPFDPFGASE